MTPTRRIFLSLIALYLCFWIIQVPQAAAEYRFDSWTTDNGLPQNGVRELTQTPDGYLWFTTFDGLVRFDGVKFTVFDKGTTKGIINNRFAGIYADKDGTVYATTLEDGSLTVYRDGVFNSYNSAQVPGHYIQKIEPDPNGELRFLVEDDDRTTKTWHYLREGQFVPGETIKVADSSVVYRGRSGTLWTVSKNGAIELKDGKETNYPRPIDKFDFTKPVFEDSTGALWVGGFELIRFKGGKIENFGEKDGFPKPSDFHSFSEEPDGSVWFANGGRSGPGAGYIRYRDGAFTKFGTESGLSGLNIFSVLKDREGTTWLATNHGLNRMKKTVIEAFSLQHGLASPEVYPILRDSKNNIWIGMTKGLSIYRGGKFETLSLKPKNMPDDLAIHWLTGKVPIQSFMEDSNGKMWIGTNGALFIAENGVVELADGDVRDHVTAILEDRDGTVWVAGNRGVSKYEGYKMKARYGAKDGLPNDLLSVAYQDSKGRLWFGGYGGLSEFRDGRFINYTKESGLSGNYVRSIYEDREGTFWIGTYDEGLTRIKDGQFTAYRVEHGLFNNGVFAIEEDEFGNFWISSNRGIYRVKKSDLNEFADGKINKINSVGYGKEDGMLNTECNGGRQPASIRDSEGKFWFPTQDGIVKIDPKAEIYNALPPPITIEAATVEREIVDISKRLLHIEPYQRNIEITYTGLSLIKSGQMKFKYKLEGHDEDWVDAGTRRTAYYSYLPPGDYVFKVMASNSDGIWNEQTASLKVEMWPYFYQTKLFILLCILLGALLLLGTWKFSVHQLAVRERKLTRLVTERTQELKEANDALQQLANSDGLTQISNRRRFEEFLAGEWHRAIRFKTEISLILIDIDHFKLFNDTYGHVSGDECLKRVAEALLETIKRPTDLLARFGGEEFVIILGGTDAEGAMTIAQNAVENINALKIPHTKSLTGEYITVSVGIATTFAIQEMSEADLIKAADRALYRAKEDGRNQIRIFNYEEELKANPEVLNEEFISVG